MISNRSLHMAALLCVLLMPVLAITQVVRYETIKEKVYGHTNHVFFKGGETVYFKLYVVNGQTQQPTRQSKVVYAELIGPSGKVLQTMNYPVQHGYAEGSYDFTEGMPGGIYRLRAYTKLMLNESDSLFWTKELTLQKVIAPRILMRLELLRKAYGPGDEVTADLSLRSIADEPIKNYDALYSVSLGGKEVFRSSCTTGHDGKALIRFRLPDTLLTNDGLLNVRVQFEGFTESISRSIPIVLNHIDLQFMPEGGLLVQGIPARVAFKALNEFGKAADVKGVIYDDLGMRITAFESYHMGMGAFELTPQPGRRYIARLTAPVSKLPAYALPVAVPEGVGMRVNRPAGKVVIGLTVTAPMAVKVAGMYRTKTCFEKELFLKAGENRVEVDEAAFPPGIARFTVYTVAGVPLSERLVFLHADQHLKVSLRTNKRHYLPREKVTLTLTTTDASGKPVPANFSLAVLDDKLWTMADDKQDNILSWLLVSSELKGKVEEPAFYFRDTVTKAPAALDLLMLTHGYRYFDYTTYVQLHRKLQYLPEQSNVLSGVIADEKGNPIAGTVYLVNEVDKREAMSCEAGSDGMFFFSGLNAHEPYYLIAQAAGKDKKVKIRVLQNGLGYEGSMLQEGKTALQGNRMVVDPLFGKPAILQPLPNVARDAFAEFLGKPSKLDEVVVIGYGTSSERLCVGSVTTVKATDITTTSPILALQGRVPGLTITNGAGISGDVHIMVRGMNSLSYLQPLLIVDGVPVEYVNLKDLAVADITSIDVLKDATATALYGSRAANGVVLIATKKTANGSFNWKTHSKRSVTTEGIITPGSVDYAAVRRFYAPLYTSTDTKAQTDFRETIYWNPTVQTDTDGKAEVSFYNSDASTTFRAIAEGIGYQGTAGRAEATYSTQKALGLDVKIPPYLTVGDSALLPFVLKNNTETVMHLTVELMPDKRLGIKSSPVRLSLQPDSTRQVLLPLQILAPMHDTVRFHVYGSGRDETLSFPVEVAEKGFPVRYTLAGKSNARFTFRINQAVPGSINTHFKLYKDIESQLLDGIESMLREPYGCFEQTSSSVYPNIYILKYLRQKGRSNPEIEKRALGYLQRGYKRLVSFETAQQGFEWFGKTPPHEALTAYGLMEFTDMREFIDVDAGLLQRTKAFLLKRRDGNGGFKQASGGYDRFASVPNRIANVYIVYALSQAGIGMKEMADEYTATFARALSSNDGYMMSMMALAADNLQQKDDYNTLIKRLDKLYKPGELSSETSVTNSGGASLRTEALSLYAMALMRSPAPLPDRVGELLQQIFAAKTYYGFGSTQGTILALQAMVQFEQLTQSATKELKVSFAMNGVPVVNARDANAALQSGDNHFAVTYDNTSAMVPFSMEVAYHTLLPPVSEYTPVRLLTGIANRRPMVGETVRMHISVTNSEDKLQPMTIAKIGIPAGLSLQPWQLKEFMEQQKIAYYELFDNYLVFYWMGMAPNETKKLDLDLKAEVPGLYKAKAGTVYLYYTPEDKHWCEGTSVEVRTLP